MRLLENKKNLGHYDKKSTCRYALRGTTWINPRRTWMNITAALSEIRAQSQCN